MKKAIYIWEEAIDKYFNASFQTLILNQTIQRWSHVDILFRFIIALTASGSAVSGWALWEMEGGKIIWIIISSFSALITTTYSIIPITTYLKNGNKSLKRYLDIISQFEIYIKDFKFDEGSNLEAHNKRLNELIMEYSKISVEGATFPFITKRFHDKAHKNIIKQFISKGIYPEETLA